MDHIFSFECPLFCHPDSEQSSSGDQSSTSSEELVSYTSKISNLPSELTSSSMGVERISSVSPKSTSHAVLASSPVTMLNLLLVVSLDTITANNSPSPHLSLAALVEVMLLLKSPIIEPYKSEP